LNVEIEIGYEIGSRRVGRRNPVRLAPLEGHQGNIMARGLYSMLAAAAMLLAAAWPAAADESPLPNADYGISTIWRWSPAAGACS
jgi:hypothetical protein